MGNGGSRSSVIRTADVPLRVLEYLSSVAQNERVEFAESTNKKQLMDYAQARKSEGAAVVKLRVDDDVLSIVRDLAAHYVARHQDDVTEQGKEAKASMTEVLVFSDLRLFSNSGTASSPFPEYSVEKDKGKGKSKKKRLVLTYGGLEIRDLDNKGKPVLLAYSEIDTQVDKSVIRILSKKTNTLVQFVADAESEAKKVYHNLMCCVALCENGLIGNEVDVMRNSASLFDVCQLSLMLDLVGKEVDVHAGDAAGPESVLSRSNLQLHGEPTLLSLTEKDCALLLNRAQSLFEYGLYWMAVDDCCVLLDLHARGVVSSSRVQTQARELRYKSLAKLLSMVLEDVSLLDGMSSILGAIAVDDYENVTEKRADDLAAVLGVQPAPLTEKIAERSKAYKDVPEAMNMVSRDKSKNLMQIRKKGTAIEADAQELDLSLTSISELESSGLYSLSLLRSLKLDGCKLKSLDFGELLVSLPHLQTLSVRCNEIAKVTGLCPRDSVLSVLDISGNKLTSSSQVSRALQPIASKIRRLSMYGNPFWKQSQNHMWLFLFEYRFTLFATHFPNLVAIDELDVDEGERSLANLHSVVPPLKSLSSSFSTLLTAVKKITFKTCPPFPELTVQPFRTLSSMALRAEWNVPLVFSHAVAALRCFGISTMGSDWSRFWLRRLSSWLGSRAICRLLSHLEFSTTVSAEDNGFHGLSIGSSTADLCFDFLLSSVFPQSSSSSFSSPSSPSSSSSPSPAPSPASSSSLSSFLRDILASMGTDFGIETILVVTLTQVSRFSSSSLSSLPAETQKAASTSLSKLHDLACRLLQCFSPTRLEKIFENLTSGVLESLCTFLSTFLSSDDLLFVSSVCVFLSLQPFFKKLGLESVVKKSWCSSNVLESILKRMASSKQSTSDAAAGLLSMLLDFSDDVSMHIGGDTDSLLNLLSRARINPDNSIARLLAAYFSRSVLTPSTWRASLSSSSSSAVLLKGNWASLASALQLCAMSHRCALDADRDVLLCSAMMVLEISQSIVNNDVVIWSPRALESLLVSVDIKSVMTLSLECLSILGQKYWSTLDFVTALTSVDVSRFFPLLGIRVDRMFIDEEIGCRFGFSTEFCCPDKPTNLPSTPTSSSSSSSSGSKTPSAGGPRSLLAATPRSAAPATPRASSKLKTLLRAFWKDRVLDYYSLASAFLESAAKNPHSRRRIRNAIWSAAVLDDLSLNVDDMEKVMSLVRPVSCLMAELELGDRGSCMTPALCSSIRLLSWAYMYNVHSKTEFPDHHRVLKLCVSYVEFYRQMLMTGIATVDEEASADSSLDIVLAVIRVCATTGVPSLHDAAEALSRGLVSMHGRGIAVRVVEALSAVMESQTQSVHLQFLLTEDDMTSQFLSVMLSFLFTRCSAAVSVFSHLIKDTAVKERILNHLKGVLRSDDIVSVVDCLSPVFVSAKDTSGLLFLLALNDDSEVVFSRLSSFLGVDSIVDNTFLSMMHGRRTELWETWCRIRDLWCPVIETALAGQDSGLQELALSFLAAYVSQGGLLNALPACNLWSSLVKYLDSHPSPLVSEMCLHPCFFEHSQSHADVIHVSKVLDSLRGILERPWDLQSPIVSIVFLRTCKLLESGKVDTTESDLRKLDGYLCSAFRSVLPLPQGMSDVFGLRLDILLQLTQQVIKIIGRDILSNGYELCSQDVLATLTELLSMDAFCGRVSSVVSLLGRFSEAHFFAFVPVMTSKLQQILQKGGLQQDPAVCGVILASISYCLRIVDDMAGLSSKSWLGELLSVVLNVPHSFWTSCQSEDVGLYGKSSLAHAFLQDDRSYNDFSSIRMSHPQEILEQLLRLDEMAVVSVVLGSPAYSRLLLSDFSKNTFSRAFFSKIFGCPEGARDLASRIVKAVSNFCTDSDFSSDARCETVISLSRALSWLWSYWSRSEAEPSEIRPGVVDPIVGATKYLVLQILKVDTSSGQFALDISATCFRQVMCIVLDLCLMLLSGQSHLHTRYAPLLEFSAQTFRDASRGLLLCGPDLVLCGYVEKLFSLPFFSSADLRAMTPGFNPSLLYDAAFVCAAKNASSFEFVVLWTSLMRLFASFDDAELMFKDHGRVFGLLSVLLKDPSFTSMVSDVLPFACRVSHLRSHHHALCSSLSWNDCLELLRCRLADADALVLCRLSLQQIPFTSEEILLTIRCPELLQSVTSLAFHVACSAPKLWQVSDSHLGKVVDHFCQMLIRGVHASCRTPWFTLRSNLGFEAGLCASDAELFATAFEVSADPGTLYLLLQKMMSADPLFISYFISYGGDARFFSSLSSLPDSGSMLIATIGPCILNILQLLLPKLNKEEFAYNLNDALVRKILSVIDVVSAAEGRELLVSMLTSVAPASLMSQTRAFLFRNCLRFVMELIDPLNRFFSCITSSAREGSPKRGGRDSLDLSPSNPRDSLLSRNFMIDMVSDEASVLREIQSVVMTNLLVPGYAQLDLALGLLSSSTKFLALSEDPSLDIQEFIDVTESAWRSHQGKPGGVASDDIKVEVRLSLSQEDIRVSVVAVNIPVAVQFSSFLQFYLVLCRLAPDVVLPFLLSSEVLEALPFSQQLEVVMSLDSVLTSSAEHVALAIARFGIGKVISLLHSADDSSHLSKSFSMTVVSVAEKVFSNASVSFSSLSSDDVSRVFEFCLTLLSSTSMNLSAPERSLVLRTSTCVVNAVRSSDSVGFARDTLYRLCEMFLSSMIVDMWTLFSSSIAIDMLELVSQSLAFVHENGRKCVLPAPLLKSDHETALWEAICSGSGAGAGSASVVLSPSSSVLNKQDVLLMSVEIASQLLTYRLSDHSVVVRCCQSGKFSQAIVCSESVPTLVPVLQSCFSSLENAEREVFINQVVVPSGLGAKLISMIRSSATASSLRDIFSMMDHIFRDSRRSIIVSEQDILRALANTTVLLPSSADSIVIDESLRFTQICLDNVRIGLAAVFPVGPVFGSAVTSEESSVPVSTFCSTVLPSLISFFFAPDRSVGLRTRAVALIVRIIRRSTVLKDCFQRIASSTGEQDLIEVFETFARTSDISMLEFLVVVFCLPAHTRSLSKYRLSGFTDELLKFASTSSDRKRTLALLHVWCQHVGVMLAEEDLIKIMDSLAGLLVDSHLSEVWTSVLELIVSICSVDQMRSSSTLFDSSLSMSLLSAASDALVGNIQLTSRIVSLVAKGRPTRSAGFAQLCRRLLDNSRLVLDSGKELVHAEALFRILIDVCESLVTNKDYEHMCAATVTLFLDWIEMNPDVCSGSAFAIFPAVVAFVSRFVRAGHSELLRGHPLRNFLTGVQQAASNHASAAYTMCALMALVQAQLSPDTKSLLSILGEHIARQSFDPWMMPTVLKYLEQHAGAYLAGGLPTSPVGQLERSQVSRLSDLMNLLQVLDLDAESFACVGKLLVVADIDDIIHVLSRHECFIPLFFKIAHDFPVLVLRLSQAFVSAVIPVEVPDGLADSLWDASYVASRPLPELFFSSMCWTGLEQSIATVQSWSRTTLDAVEQFFVDALILVLYSVCPHVALRGACTPPIPIGCASLAIDVLLLEPGIVASYWIMHFDGLPELSRIRKIVFKELLMSSVLELLQSFVHKDGPDHLSFARFEPRYSSIVERILLSVSPDRRSSVLSVDESDADASDLAVSLRFLRLFSALCETFAAFRVAAIQASALDIFAGILSLECSPALHAAVFDSAVIICVGNASSSSFVLGSLLSYHKKLTERTSRPSVQPPTSRRGSAERQSLGMLEMPCELPAPQPQQQPSQMSRENRSRRPTDSLEQAADAESSSPPTSGSEDVFSPNVSASQSVDDLQSAPPSRKSPVIPRIPFIRILPASSASDDQLNSP
eukprot:ANDGO_07034.mRNA.1 hypothetical protein